MDLLGRRGYMREVLFLLEGGLRDGLSQLTARAVVRESPFPHCGKSFLLLTCSPSLTPAALLSTGDEENHDGFVLTTPRPHLPS